MRPTEPPLIHVACLCAAWCRLCEGYAAVFQEALKPVLDAHPGVRTHWIDIEDEADLLGNVDIETFPTLVVVDEARVRFCGPIEPQPATLLRVVRAALVEPFSGAAQPVDVEAFGARLRCDRHLQR